MQESSIKTNNKTMLRPGHLKNMYGLFITDNRLKQYSVSKYYLRFLISEQ